MTHQAVAAHITHEAADRMGGIGTVLGGLVNSRAYRAIFPRSILVGPTFCAPDARPNELLGPHGTVLYSGAHGIDLAGSGARLRPVEAAHGVRIIHGHRPLERADGSGWGESAEVLLVDVRHVDGAHVNRLKGMLYDALGIPSDRYECDWSYEEYVRLAGPALDALAALLEDQRQPCMLFGHEFMGLPTLYAATIRRDHRFKTVYYAHECPTARHLVESLPGHDVAFYHALELAEAEGRSADDVFGDCAHLHRHALVSRCAACDAVLAVGPDVAREIRFLDARIDPRRLAVVYNGVPSTPVAMAQRRASRTRLARFASAGLGSTGMGSTGPGSAFMAEEPHVLMTHVTRLVTSKAMWRDLLVCDRLEGRFARSGLRGVLIMLVSPGWVKGADLVRSMHKAYGWPFDHREGHPDLAGPEIELWRHVAAFNRNHRRIRVLLVNQFGWSPQLIGPAVPEGMDMADLRRATDIEFGLATYEPFGISPLEPLASGALCVISATSGCAGLVRAVAGNREPENIIVADFTRGAHPRPLAEWRHMGAQERDVLEAKVAEEVAGRIMERLPLDDAGREALLRSGAALASRMDWDAIVSERLEPVLRPLLASGGRGGAMMAAAAG